VQGLDGNFYGTTSAGGIVTSICGGSGSCGTVFKITPSGTLTTLYKFCSQPNCTDGISPNAGLVLATNGKFYGTTVGGGTDGTVFEITAGGKFTTLHSFDGTDGSGPYGTLVQATDGDFYGITMDGGANNAGTVFKITPAGTVTTLYSFCAQSNCADGQLPFAGLIQATDGNLYGTTDIGGISGNGTVFKITPQGALTTLHRFTFTDGSQPSGGLVQGTDGNLYGMTESGGANVYGTVFKITPTGTLTTLYSFCTESNCTDGSLPQYTGLVQATDGNFYGITADGGANSSCGSFSSGCGTIFSITSSGTLTTLHSFDGTDGEYPFSGLVQATNGNFYGTTLGNIFSNTCSGGCGTVFSLSVGLGPFVETLPTSGKVGTTIKILGNKLTGASNVSFNGTSATFSVISSTYIKTTVPTGATTGFVTVTTPNGTLKSNKFRVTP